MRGHVHGVTVVVPKKGTFVIMRHEASNAALVNAGYSWNGEQWTINQCDVDTTDAGKCHDFEEASSYCGDWLVIVDGMYPYQRDVARRNGVISW